MPYKPEFVDYEPVTPGTNARLRGQADYWSEAESPAAVPVAARVKPISIATKPSSPLAQQEPTRRYRILKRGHAFSFAGLFLFTVILYFRPYELFPFLKWATSSAFWTALFTLVAYGLTQLGLEGNFTMREREITHLLLLAGACVLSIPLALDRDTAFYGVVDFLKVIAMFIVLVNVVRTEQRLRLLFLLVIVVSVVMSVSALNDYRLAKLASHGERIKGLIGNMFDNPNDLALHLITIIPISVVLALSSRNVFKKILFAITSVIMVAGVVATFSRGGFLGLACVTVVLAWRLARKNKVLVVAVLPVAVLLFVMFAPGGYGTRMANTVDDSAVLRRDDLKHSIYIMSRHPVFGVGFCNYVLYSNSNHASHNAYTQVGSELGIAAMIVYILFQLAPLKELRRIGRETSTTRRKSRFYYYSMGLEASILGFMVSSFFGSVAFLWYIYYIVGYAICLRNLYESDKTRKLNASANADPGGRQLSSMTRAQFT